jgi:hypothetical protein
MRLRKGFSDKLPVVTPVTPESDVVDTIITTAALTDDEIPAIDRVPSTSDTPSNDTFDGVDVSQIHGKIPGIPFAIKPTELVDPRGQQIGSTADPDLVLQQQPTKSIELAPLEITPPPEEVAAEPPAEPPPSPAKKFVLPMAGIAGAATTKVGAALGKTRATIAKPFQGDRPLHKRPLFWGGLGVGTTALALGGAWAYVDSTVGQYSPKAALTFARPGTVYYCKPAMPPAKMSKSGRCRKNSIGPSWRSKIAVFTNTMGSIIKVLPAP